MAPVVPGAVLDVACVNGAWIVVRPRPANERGASGPPYAAVDGPYATRTEAEHAARLLSWRLLRGGKAEDEHAP